MFKAGSKINMAIAIDIIYHLGLFKHIVLDTGHVPVFRVKRGKRFLLR
jgi:hypothetical protein